MLEDILLHAGGAGGASVARMTSPSGAECIYTAGA